MNSLIKTLAFCAALGASGSAHAVTVGVDSNKIWNGFMNVFELPANGGGFVFGSGWGTGDLVAGFSGGSLTLSPNTIGDPAPFWYTPSGGPGATGNKIMEANYYVIVPDGELSGQTLTFQGTVLSNSLTSAHVSKAFIKEFAADYSSVVGVNEVVLTPGAFSISLPISGDPTRHVQYGFQTVGENVWVTDVGPFGSVVIQDDPAPFVPDQILNGDFEIADGAGWGTTQGNVTYPTTGGNPDGNAVLASPGGFAVLYAFNNSEKTFASLGLSPGENYILQVDMKVVSGNIGGIRLEGPAGYVVDQFAPENVGGADWATYSFNLTVPASPAQAKFGLRTPDGSTVAFDNVMIVLPAPPGAPNSSIATGNIVGWTAASAENTYLPQQSTDNDIWTDIGTPLTGNTVTNRFALGKSPFYRVLETTPPTSGNAVSNPGFEDSDSDLFPWIIVPQGAGTTATPESAYLSYTPVTGDRMLKLEAENLANPIPPAEVGVRSNQIAVTAGTSYTLNFSAAAPELGASFEVGVKLRYFDEFGAPAGLSAETKFSSPAWAPYEVSFTAPAEVGFVRVDIFLRSGAVANVKGVALIDDVILLTPLAPGESTAIAATATPAVQVTFDTFSGSSYQVKSSPDLSDWSNFGTSVNGTGSPFSVVDPITPPKKFYRVLQTTP